MRLMLAIPVLGCLATCAVSSLAAVPTARPRVLLTPTRLTELRRMACYDANGAKLPGCAAAPEWDLFHGQVSAASADMTAWNFALAYLVTKNASFAQRAIGMIDAQIADGMADERFDQFLYVCYQMRDAACTYDWLYPLLSADRRARWRSYMNQVLTELWNPESNPHAAWAGWGVSDPGNNYHYSFLLATALVGLALHGDNPTPPTLPFEGRSYTDILAFLQAKLRGVAAWSSTWGKGGGWHEGDSYGKLAKRHMFDLFLALRDGGVTDYFKSLAFPREALAYQLYACQPGYRYVCTGGDLPNYGFNTNQYDRNLLMQLADGLAGTAEGEYAQYLVDHVFGPSTSARFQYPADFLLSRPGAPAKDIATLPLSYHAEGLGWVNSRSGWRDDAVSVSFVSTGRVQGHQHQDQNSFLIFYKDWQAVDANVYTHSQIVMDPQCHNLIWVDGHEQRFGEGTGRIFRYESTADFTYAAGDASDAYYSEVGGYGTGRSRLLATNIRELVHLLPNYVLVYDRVSPAEPSTAITCLLNTPKQPAVNGMVASSTNGGGRIFQKTLLPAGAAISTDHFTVDQGDSWQVQVKAALPAAHYTFLNLLQVSDSRETSMTPSEAIIEAKGKMAGVLIFSGGRNTAALFSSGNDASPVTDSVSYTFSPRADTVLHLLFDLPPKRRFGISVTRGVSQTVTITPDSGEFTSSGQGVLAFTTTRGSSSVG